MIDTLLLSYPRSANSWIRYQIEFLTQKPTVGYDTDHPLQLDKPLLCEYIPIAPEEHEEPIAIKRHMPEDCKRLIVLLRNYKECIPRHRETIRKNKKQIMLDSCTGITPSNNYMDILKFYDEFEGDKLLIYYADMIENPARTIEQLEEFFGTDKERTKLFMDSFEMHREYMVKRYKGSRTGGESIIHHSKALSEEFKNEWDAMLEKQYPELYNKYLTRFKE